MSSTDIRLRWTGDELLFQGGADGGPQITLDSARTEGPSPMQGLLLSLAACMAIDVKLILDKSRVPVDALEVTASGDRADSEPRRFVAVRLTYHVRGPLPEHDSRLERAVGLSRDKYCSVLHTLNPDLDLSIQIVRS